MFPHIKLTPNITVNCLGSSVNRKTMILLRKKMNIMKSEVSTKMLSTFAVELC